MADKPIFDPRVDPSACVICKSEDVRDSENMRPSGIAPKVICANGHETNGMPTEAFFSEQAKANA